MTDSPSPSSGHVGVRPRPSQVPPDDFDPEPKGTGARILIAIFVGLPFLALLAAVPLAWGWGLGWHDIVIGAITACSSPSTAGATPRATPTSRRPPAPPTAGSASCSPEP
jgi:hypothetical protein